MDKEQDYGNKVSEFELQFTFKKDLFYLPTMG